VPSAGTELLGEACIGSFEISLVYRAAWRPFFFKKYFPNAFRHCKALTPQVDQRSAFVFFGILEICKPEAKPRKATDFKSFS
jgi:hypothetical protein